MPRKTRSAARLVEARNQADALVHSDREATARAWRQGRRQEKGDRSRDGRAKEAVKGDDAEEIEADHGPAQASMKLGEAMYKAQQAKAQQAPPRRAAEEAPKADDNVVDADFEEVDDNKKRAA